MTRKRNKRKSNKRAMKGGMEATATATRQSSVAPAVGLPRHVDPDGGLAHLLAQAEIVKAQAQAQAQAERAGSGLIAQGVDPNITSTLTANELAMLLLYHNAIPLPPKLCRKKNIDEMTEIQKKLKKGVNDKTGTHDLIVADRVCLSRANNILELMMMKGAPKPTHALRAVKILKEQSAQRKLAMQNPIIQGGTAGDAVRRRTTIKQPGELLKGEFTKGDYDRAMVLIQSLKEGTYEEKKKAMELIVKCETFNKAQARARDQAQARDQALARARDQARDRALAQQQAEPEPQPEPEPEAEADTWGAWTRRTASAGVGAGAEVVGAGAEALASATSETTARLHELGSRLFSGPRDVLGGGSKRRSKKRTKRRTKRTKKRRNKKISKKRY